MYRDVLKPRLDEYTKYYGYESTLDSVPMRDIIHKITDPAWTIFPNSFLPKAHTTLLVLHAHEHMPPEAVRADLLAALERVARRAGEDLAPDDPVEEADAEDGPARDGVGPVRQVHVRARAGRRAHEGHDEEEDVRGAEERGGAHGERRRPPPVGVRPEVQVDDAEGDDGVDDGEGVRNLCTV